MSASLNQPPDWAGILIIDDDPLSRCFLELSLRDTGHKLFFVSDGPSATATLTRCGPGSFACVVADCGSLGQPAGVLLEWIYKTEPELATLLTVDEDEAGSSEEWLRAGALDVLRRPFSRNRITVAVVTAASRSAQNRKLDRMRREVESIGRLQHSMLGAASTDAGNHPLSDRENTAPPPGLAAEVCFRPCHQAGGDFFSQFRLSATRYAALITDVSGHDLHSAYVSAYLQGMVRASLLLDSPLFDVLASCNQVLLDGWCGFDRTLPSSVSVCSVVVDTERRSLQVASCGSPLPVLVTLDGRCLQPGRIVSSPLGWFPFEPTMAPAKALWDDTDLVTPEGNLLLWTDGLEELSGQLGASPLSVAYQLFQARRAGIEPAWLRNAGDDVMAVRLSLQPDSSVDACPFHPLLTESYSIEDIPRIDELQDYWRASLNLALENPPSAVLHDVLLCSREAVLNALTHGCKAGQRSVFQACIDPRRRSLRLRIEDPGGGHDFIPPHSNEAGETVADGLAALHRGLLLIDHLCPKVQRERRGAGLTLDFEIENSTT
jgi:DNA-binding response OmpR family regulator/anti-sigma regulatory factor (Ser/Thr protein kinase)